MNFAKKFAKNPKAARPNKTTESYWMTKVSKGRGSSIFNVRIMHQGESKNVSLGVSNQKEAAKRAAKLYLDVKLSGWVAALNDLGEARGKKLLKRVEAVEAKGPDTQTLGWFLEQASTVLGPRAAASTISAYTNAFRHIAREAFDKKKVSCKAAEELPLAWMTAEAIKTWRDNRFKRFSDQRLDALALNRKKRSINATVRNAAALFSNDTLEQISQRAGASVLTNPFAGLKPLTVPQSKYSSKINITLLVGAARAHFRRDVVGSDETDAAVWIVFLLAFYAGLRANEIDKLQWSQVDLEKKLISINPTDCFTAKTQSSNAEVPIEDQVAAELNWYRAKLPKNSKFVICPGIPLPVGKTGPERRRLNAPFTLLCGWLRNYEEDGTKPLAEVQKPLHELRKEAGSVIMRGNDIYQASLFLRHSNIQTTVNHYADTRSKKSVGLGHLLNASA